MIESHINVQHAHGWILISGKSRAIICTIKVSSLNLGMVRY